MQEAISKISEALSALGRGSPWDGELKVSDEFLTPVFQAYYKKLELPNSMAKKQFHELARFVPLNEIDPEVSEKLDAIAQTACGTVR